MQVTNQKWNKWFVVLKCERWYYSYPSCNFAWSISRAGLMPWLCISLKIWYKVIAKLKEVSTSRYWFSANDGGGAWRNFSLAVINSNGDSCMQPHTLVKYIELRNNLGQERSNLWASICEGHKMSINYCLTEYKISNLQEDWVEDPN